MEEIKIKKNTKKDTDEQKLRESSQGFYVAEKDKQVFEEYGKINPYFKHIPQSNQG